MDYITVKNNETKFAYVWYATGGEGTHYLCSALIAMKHLKSLRSNANLNCDYVLLYSKDNGNQNRMDKWKREGIFRILKLIIFHFLC